MTQAAAGPDCARLRGAHRSACQREATGQALRDSASAGGADPCLRKRGRTRRACEHSAARRRHELAEADAPSTASAAVAKAAARSSDHDGGYLVQVGAYKTRADAKAELARLSTRVAGSGVVETGGGAFRARFTGLTHAQAKATCQKLSAHGQRCMVMTAS